MKVLPILQDIRTFVYVVFCLQLDTPNRSIKVPPSVFFFCGITKTSHKALSSDCKHHSIPRRMLQPCLTSHRLPFRDAHEILMYCWTFLNKLASTGRTNVWVWKK